MSSCVLAEITQIWSEVYALTTKRRYQSAQDALITTHHAMYLEDLGLGVNDGVVHSAFTSELHTNKGGWENTENFRCALCELQQSEDGGGRE